MAVAIASAEVAQYLTMYSFAAIDVGRIWFDYSSAIIKSVEKILN
jgi:hypothetical protein